MNDRLEPVAPTLPERLLGAVAMVGVGLLAVLVTANVLSRWLARSIVPDDILLVQELMVAVILLPLGLVTAARAHIAVTVFTDRLSTGAVRRLTVLGHAIGLVVALIFLWAAWRGLARSWASGEFYDGAFSLPMWPGWMLFAFAMAVFAMRLAAMIAIDMRRPQG